MEVCRGERTSEAINRVIRRADKMAESYVGDPAPYFYTVAQNLYLEYLRTTPASSPLAGAAFVPWLTKPKPWLPKAGSGSAR